MHIQFIQVEMDQFNDIYVAVYVVIIVGVGGKVSRELIKTAVFIFIPV